MMNEKECRDALDYLYAPLANTMVLEMSYDLLINLIDEHFNPQPYKFEDLKKGMWVWDEDIGACMFVKEVNRKINIFTLVGGESFLLETVNITVKFEENRFYPVTKTLEAK